MSEHDERDSDTVLIPIRVTRAERAAIKATFLGSIGNATRMWWRVMAQQAGVEWPAEQTGERGKYPRK